MRGAIVQLFNSSSISGPERLVLPAMRRVGGPCVIVNLREERIGRLKARDPIEDFSRSLGLPFRAVRVRGRWDGRAVVELSSLLEDLRPVLVHAHDVKASAYLIEAGKIRPQARRLTVSTHHGVHGRPDLKTRLYEWIYRRFVLPHFDRVLGVSRSDFLFLKESGLNPARLRLHLNGINGRCVDPEERASRSRRIRAEWLPGEPGRDELFLIGAVGRLSAEKDHARLLAVLARLNRLPCSKPWKCLIFGEGPLRGRLRLSARWLGLKERVVWMGYCDGIGDELSGLDLLASFSKAEGLPVSLIEAGWAGTPVYATRVGGVPDLIADEGCGTLVAPDERPDRTATRLRDLLEEDGRAGLNAQGSRLQARVASEFSQDRWLRTLVEIYAGLDVELELTQEAAS